jgi:hypothetical protein
MDMEMPTFEKEKKEQLARVHARGCWLEQEYRLSMQLIQDRIDTGYDCKNERRLLRECRETEGQAVKDCKQMCRDLAQEITVEKQKFKAVKSEFRRVLLEEWQEFEAMLRGLEEEEAVELWKY